MSTYMLLGGGTAGHVNPLLAVAERIREQEPGSEIIIVGTAEGLEARLVPERGFELHVIERLPLPRSLNSQTLSFPRRFNAAVRDLRQLIRRRGVEVVVGFGGYASAPGYEAARKENVPIVIHEANAKPGLANRLAARYTPYVGVAFTSTRIRNAHLVGMPLRPEIETLDRAQARQRAISHFGLNPSKPVLLVTGGSQGARSLNLALSSAATEITDLGWQVLHIWGERTEIDAPDVADYHVLRYCDRMDLALAVADFAISRAGSATVSELAGLGIPSLLVPYPVGNGEQKYNAQDLVAAGGAKVVADARLSPEWLSQNIWPILRDPSEISAMGGRASNAGSLDGTEKLLALVRNAQATHGTVERR